MKHRFLITALASVMLAGGIGAVTSDTQPTQASKIGIEYTGTAANKRKIINQGYYTECLTDKKIKVAKIHWHYPLYKSTLTKGYYVSKNSIVYIKKSGFNFGWYLKASRHAKTTYTVLKRLGDYSWFELW